MLICPVTFRALLDDPSWPELQGEYEAECALSELGKYEPQRDLYAAMEASGNMRCFGVYAGGLVGFINVIIFTVPHSGEKMAATESFFLAESHRPGGLGLEMLNFLRIYAKDQGCKVIQCTAPVGSQFAKLLSLKHEWRHSNNVHVMSL